MLSQELKSIYTVSDRRRLLLDPEYFSEQLMKYYQPAYKSDCKILDTASRCGVGKVLVQYLDQNLWMTEDDKNTTAAELTKHCSLSEQDAYRAVSFFSYMMGWDETPPCEAPDPVQQYAPPQPAAPVQTYTPPEPQVPVQQYTPPQPQAPVQQPASSISQPSVSRSASGGLSSSVSRMKAKLRTNTASFRKADTFRKLSVWHLVLCILHVVLLVLMLSNASTGSKDPFGMIGDAIGMAVASSLISTHLIFSVIGAIFSFVGILIKTRWPYLVSAIIDTVGCLFAINLFFLAPIIGMIAVGVFVLGYVTFAKGKTP